MLKLAFLASYLYTFAYDAVSSSTRLAGVVRRFRPTHKKPNPHRKMTIKCLPDGPFIVVVAFDINLDNPNNLRERFLKITNGLLPGDSSYEGIVLRIRLAPYGHLLLKATECTDGVTFDVPSRYQRPKLPVYAHVVHRDGGIWVESGGKGLSPFVAPNLQPIIMQTVTDTFRRAGRAVNWEDDVFESEDDR